MAIETDIRAASKALTVAEQHIKQLPGSGGLLIALESLQVELSDKLETFSPYMLPRKWFGGGNDH